MTDEGRIKQLKNSKIITLGDALTIIAVLVISLLLLIPSLLPKSKGSEVIISVRGEQSRYDLNQNREIEVGGVVIAIEDGSVFVKSATCPDKICYHTGKINGVGEKIVCTPNGVVITIVGSGEFNADTGGIV